MNNKTRKVLLLLASLAASVALVCGCAGGADSGGSGGVTDSVSSETGGGSEQQEATILVTELSHVYDGTAKQVGVKVAPAAAGTPTIKYFSGEEEVTSCVKAGPYTVEVSRDGGVPCGNGKKDDDDRAEGGFFKRNYRRR